MGTVSFEVPGPGTYQVTCDPKLDPLSNAGGAGDVLAGKQFYNDRNQTITGSMPNNAPAQVNVAGGESYTIPRGYHDGTGKVTGTGTVLPALTNPGTAGDLLENKQLLDGNGNVVTGTLVPGSDTGDATATAGDILAPKTAYVAAGKVTGTIATKGEGDVTADGPLVAVPPGYYPQAVNKSISDPDLVPGNIKAGVEIFGVTGTFEGGLPEGVRTITLTADPPEGGTVSGGGVATDGMILTITAEPNEADNYYFEGWKENGTVVSTETLYQFPITADRSLVAAFFQSQYVPGVDWWAATLSSSANWYSVTYGDGKFVAVANGSDKAAYSTDGITWTETALPSSAYWQSITYGGGKFVAVLHTGNKAAYSTDGITWTETALPSSAYWQSITYGGGKFVAVDSRSDKAAYSTDGITWTPATLPSSGNWQSVTYGGGKFVVVVYNGNKAAYSTDGITWTETALPSSAGWRSVTYGDGKFVAVASGSDKAAYSSAKGPGA